MYKMIADSFFKETPNLSNVRLMFSAGAPLPDEVEAKFFEKFNIHIRQLYGSTETGAVAISYGENSGEVDSVGRPLHGVQIDIFDEEGRVISNGAIGDVAIHSPAMTHQYDGLPDATSECFIDNYFYPGDLGCKDEHGNLYIKGRKKLMINVAGYKVDPIDVEDVIRSHPGLEDVVVVGKPHDKYGEMVKAVVVKGENHEVDQNMIIEMCREKLAEYKTPKVVEFRDEIPRSPLGKILRKYL
jgi:long-chain acyl-CoA synthetase